MADINLVLPFTMENQLPQNNWCWAATAKSVYVYYFPRSSRWSQCKIAKEVFTSSTCCTDRPSCDFPATLQLPLQVTKNYVNHFAGVVTWVTIRNEIANTRRVLCARIAWDEGGGHFVAIYGVRKIGTTADRLYIADPLYEEVIETYTRFKNNYRGRGCWSHTYYTDKTMPAGA